MKMESSRWVSPTDRLRHTNDDMPPVYCTSSPPPTYQMEQIRANRIRRERRAERHARKTSSAVTILYPSSEEFFANRSMDQREYYAAGHQQLIYQSHCPSVKLIYPPEHAVINGFQAVSFQPPRQQFLLENDADYEAATNDLSSVSDRDAEEAQPKSPPPFYEEHFSCSPPPVLILTVSLIQCILFGVLNSFDSLPATPSSPQTATGLPCVYETLALSWKSWTQQPWRLFTYALLHNDLWHVLFTVGSQAVLGICLELVHTWRVLAVYCAGIFGGAVGYLLFSYAKFYYYFHFVSSAIDCAEDAAEAKQKYLAMLPEAIIIGSSSGCYALLACQFVNFALNYRRMVMASVQLAALLVYAVIEVVAQIVYYQPNGFILTAGRSTTPAPALNLPTEFLFEERAASDLIDITESDNFNGMKFAAAEPLTSASVMFRPGVLNRDTLWLLDEHDDDGEYYDMILRALRETNASNHALLNESTACHVFGALAGLIASLFLLRRIGGRPKPTKADYEMRRPSRDAMNWRWTRIFWRANKAVAIAV